MANPNAEADAASAAWRSGGHDGTGRPRKQAQALPAANDAAAPSTIRLQRFDFVVQFCWQPKTPTERRDAKKAKEQAANPAQP